MNCRNVLIVLASLLGVVLIILGAALGFSILPDYVHEEIAKQVRLENGTDQYKRWEELPFALVFKVYLFEILNPDEVLLGETPVVKERGPYVYNQRRHKVDISYNEENDTLTYKQFQYFSFNQELSGDNSEEEEFFVLNTPLYVAFQTLGEIAESHWEAAFIDHETIGPFVKMKVREYLFDGFVFCRPEVKEIDWLCMLMAGTTEIIDTLELTEDGAVSFAFFRFKDNAHDGEYTITAGMDVVEDLGLIRSWKGGTELPKDVWGTEGTCKEIKGRDSTIYGPYIEEEDVFDIFSTDICRVVTLEYYGQETYKGIEGQRRHLRNDTLTNTGDNSCYCTKHTVNMDGLTECFPDGFMDLYSCMMAPVVLSFPHFLWADPEIAATVIGLEAKEEEHVTFVVLEPGTGYPLKGAKRVQFNMVLRPLPDISVATRLPKAMMPLLWVEEGVNLPDDLVQELKDRYLNKLILVNAVTWTLIGVGLAMFVGFGGWFLFSRVK